MGRAPVPVSPDDKNMSWVLIPVCGVAEYGIGPVNLLLRANLVSRGGVLSFRFSLPPRLLLLLLLLLSAASLPTHAQTHSHTHLTHTQLTHTHSSLTHTAHSHTHSSLTHNSLTPHSHNLCTHTPRIHTQNHSNTTHSKHGLALCVASVPFPALVKLWCSGRGL